MKMTMSPRQSRRGSVASFNSMSSIGGSRVPESMKMALSPRQGRRGSVASLNTMGPTGGSRVPETLQTVMIMSNRGKEVHKPPPQNVACKNFSMRRGVFRRSIGKDSTNDLKSMGSSNDLKSLAPIPIEATPSQHQVSPHAYVTSILKVRGYSTTESKALQTAYYNKPTSEQKASYGKLLVNAVRDGDVNVLRELFEFGVSPNACNSHCESIVHAACRLGKIESLKVMLEHGCEVSVCDDYGRTPLHDACWTSNASFDIVEMLLERDPHMLYIADTRGSTPLTYVSKENWTEWTRFFMAKKDKFWPQRDIKKDGFLGEPERARLPPNARPVCNGSKNSVASEFIEMVAEGSMDPSDAPVRRLKRESASDLTCEESFSDDSSIDDDDTNDDNDYTQMDLENEDSEDDEDYEDDEDSDSDSDFSFDEEEMADILSSIGSMKPVAWTSRTTIELK